MLRIDREQVNRVIAHCQREAPYEACGFLAGGRERVSQVYPVKNIEPTPVSYMMEPNEQLKALREIEEKGLELLAIYHSHPGSRPFPSAKDVSLAFYPEALYVIVSLLDGAEVRAFRIAGERVSEVTIKIEP